MKLATTLLAALVLAPAAPAQIRGMVLDAAGRPAPGAQVWTDDPRLGARADAKGAFTLPEGPPQGRVWAAAGLAVGVAHVGGGRVTVRLERPEPLSPAARAELGRSLLQAAASGATIHRLPILGWLAEADPEAARRLVRSDGERGAVLVGLARAHPERGESLAEEADSLGDNFERCRAAEGIALACLEKNPAAARRAFKTVDATWRSKAIGGNDLLFPYAALAARLASPEEARTVIADADSWARLHPQPHNERATLALALGALEPTQADALLRQLPPPHDAEGYARLAVGLAPTRPEAALGFLQEAQRRGQGGPGYLEARDAALQLLLPGLARSHPETALRLVKSEPESARTLAWRIRLDSAPEPLRRERLLRRMDDAALEDALVLAEVCASTPEGKELLGRLRTKFFAAQGKAPIPIRDLLRFVALIASRDPASARAAIERANRDFHEHAVNQASTIERLAELDPQRAVTLIEGMENPDWPHVVRGRIGAYLVSGRWPDPVK